MSDKCNCQNIMHECDERNGCRIISRLTSPKPSECEPVGYFFKNDRGFWHQAGDPVGFKGLTKLYTTPQPCPDCLKWATDMSQVTKTLRYIIGIAERGTATTLPDGVTVESFVLDYVKGLEAKVAELTDKYECNTAIMHARTAKMNEYAEKLTRAEAVIGKAAVTLHNLNIQGGLGYTNHRLIEEALTVVNEYREWK